MSDATERRLNQLDKKLKNVWRTRNSYPYGSPDWKDLEERSWDIREEMESLDSNLKDWYFQNLYNSI